MLTNNITSSVPTNNALEIISLKSSYAIGGQIEFTCRTDFARPKPQLAIFLNNKRVSIQRSFIFSSIWCICMPIEKNSQTTNLDMKIKFPVIYKQNVAS